MSPLPLTLQFWIWVTFDVYQFLIQERKVLIVMTSLLRKTLETDSQILQLNAIAMQISLFVLMMYMTMKTALRMMREHGEQKAMGKYRMSFSNLKASSLPKLS